MVPHLSCGNTCPKAFQRGEADDFRFFVLYDFSSGVGLWGMMIKVQKDQRGEKTKRQAWGLQEWDEWSL